MGVNSFETFSDAFIVAKSTNKNVVICRTTKGSPEKGGPFFLLPLDKFKGTISENYTPEVCLCPEPDTEYLFTSSMYKDAARHVFKTHRRR